MNSTSAAEVSTQAVLPRDPLRVSFRDTCECRRGSTTVTRCFPAVSRLFRRREPARTGARRPQTTGASAALRAATSDRVPDGRERRARRTRSSVDDVARRSCPRVRAVATTSMRLAAPSPPTIWRAEQPAGAALGEQLHGDRLGAGEVAGPGRALDRGGDEARSRPRSASRSVSPVRATSVSQSLVTAVPTHAGEGGVAAADVDAGDPALLVGDGAEGDVDRRAGRRGGTTRSSRRRPTRRRPSCAGGGRRAIAPATPSVDAGVARPARCWARRRGRARRGRRASGRRRRCARRPGSKPGRRSAPRARRRCRARAWRRRTSAPMSGSRVRITWAAASTRVTLGAPPRRTPRPSRGRCSRRRPRPTRSRLARRPAAVLEQVGGVVEGLHAVDELGGRCRGGRGAAAGRRCRCAGWSKPSRYVRLVRRGRGPRPRRRRGRCAVTSWPQCARRCGWRRGTPAGVRATRSSRPSTAPPTRYGMPQAE